jgi:hypothetical protein
MKQDIERACWRDITEQCAVNVMGRIIRRLQLAEVETLESHPISPEKRAPM